MKSNKIAEALAEISVSLAVIKNDLEHIEERTKKLVELETRVEAIEHLIDKVKGAAIILIPIATTALTLGYMFLTKYLGM